MTNERRAKRAGSAAARPQRRARQACRRASAARSAPSSTACARAISARCRSSSAWSIIWTVFQSLNPVFLSPEQPRQPAVRLLDGRRDRARHRLHADGRRDRPVGRLDQRLRLGARRRALGQPGLAGARRHPRRARRRRADRRALCASVQPLRHAELRLDAGRPARASSGLQLYLLGSTGSINLPYGSPLVNFGQTAGHAGRGFLRAGAAPGHRDVRDRATAPRPGAARPDCRRSSLGSLIAARRRRHRRAGVHRLLPQPRTRRSVDVRPLRRPRRGR